MTYVLNTCATSSALPSNISTMLLVEDYYCYIGIRRFIRSRGYNIFYIETIFSTPRVVFRVGTKSVLPHPSRLFGESAPPPSTRKRRVKSFKNSVYELEILYILMFFLNCGKQKILGRGIKPYNPPTRDS